MEDQKKFKKVTSLIKEKVLEVLPAGSTVTLFGSRARGDAPEDSDRDIHLPVPDPEKLPVDEMMGYINAIVEIGYEINDQINVIAY